jgi:hypothetical protein
VCVCVCVCVCSLLLLFFRCSLVLVCECEQHPPNTHAHTRTHASLSCRSSLAWSVLAPGPAGLPVCSPAAAAAAAAERRCADTILSREHVARECSELRAQLAEAHAQVNRGLRGAHQGTQRIMRRRKRNFGVRVWLRIGRSRSRRCTLGRVWLCAREGEGDFPTLSFSLAAGRRARATIKRAHVHARAQALALGERGQVLLGECAEAGATNRQLQDALQLSKEQQARHSFPSSSVACSLCLLLCLRRYP